MFSITTPFGDTTFRFVERKGYRALFPGSSAHAEPVGGANQFGFKTVDHITTNFQTMAPALLWMEHVLGFERFWDIAVPHQRRGQGSTRRGSGLQVDRHVGSGVAA